MLFRSARACGVMQAAFEAGLSYAVDRKVFGKPVADYQLSLVKFARMAMYLGASRQFTYAVGRMMDDGGGQMEASLVKLLACKLSEWTIRAAMQILGRMGYVEASPASWYWLVPSVQLTFARTHETQSPKLLRSNQIE